MDGRTALAAPVIAAVIMLLPGPALSATGPEWRDVRVVNTANVAAPDRTGQWWCDLLDELRPGETWECIEAPGSLCSQPVPAQMDVSCGLLDTDGSTDYNGMWASIAPFGYGRVERVLVSKSAPGRTGEWWCDLHFGGNFGGDWKCRGVSGGNACATQVPNGELVSCSEYGDVRSVFVGGLSAPGRTGEWWCDRHFAANLGGEWDCLRVAPGVCAQDAPRNSTVTCGRFFEVDEAPFAPIACDDLENCGAEAEFCSYTEFMPTRERATLYLFNDYLRAGLNRSFGGAMFELYGTDGVNLIQQHGGSAVQLSLWGVDEAASGRSHFTTVRCDPTPYPDPATCLGANDGLPCAPGATAGAQISDCITETTCSTWSAGAPWNPIQAIASGCRWNGPSNDVDLAMERRGRVTLAKNAPNQFTKSTAFPGLTWSVSGNVPSRRPYVELVYDVRYDGPVGVKIHNQEIPALFADAVIDHWYYYYRDSQAYSDGRGSVTRLRADFGTQIKLAGRTVELPKPAPAFYQEATEEWMSICNREEDRCMTVATFTPEIPVFSLKGRYITPLARFAIPSGFKAQWKIYLFPYRYDAVVAGQSVREWIYQLKQEN